MKKKVKFLFAIIMFFIMAKTYNAAIYINDNGIIPDIKLHLKTSTTDEDIYIHKLSLSDNTPVYNFNANVLVPAKNHSTETFYYYSNINNNKKDLIARIALFGYMAEGRTDAKWYIITQALIWKCVYEDSGEIYFVDASNNRISLYEEEMTMLKNEAIDDITLPSFFSSDIYTAKIDEELVLTDEYNVLYDYNINNLTSYSLDINYEDNKLTTSIHEYMNGYIDFVRIYDEDLPRATYYYNRGEADASFSRGSINPTRRTLTIRAEKPTLTLKKDTLSTKSLAGNSYLVYNSFDMLVDTIILDKSGNSAPLGLEPDNYYLVEQTAPDGYELNDEKIPFTVTKSDVTLSLDDNAIKKNIPLNFSLKGDNSELINDNTITFEVYKDDTLIDTVKPDNNGNIIIHLPVGDFLLKQVSGSNTHKFLEPISLNITDDYDEETPLEVINDQVIPPDNIPEELPELPEEILDDMPMLTLEKLLSTPSGDLEPEEEAVFAIYQSDELIDTITTDSLGFAIISLPMGTYKIVQIKGTTGYNLMEPLTITIGKNSKNLSIKTTPIEGSLTLTYKDADTKEVVSNATVYLYNMSDELISEIKTNELGEATFTNIQVGKYYLLINDDRINVEIKNDTHSYITYNNRYQISVPKTGVNKIDTCSMYASLLLLVGLLLRHEKTC